jgi:hypothetical protein
MEGLQYLCIRPPSQETLEQIERQAFGKEKNKRCRILFHFELKTWAWFDFFQGKGY